MSVSKWRYTEACDNHMDECVGDCDFCSFDPIDPRTRIGRAIPKGEMENGTNRMRVALAEMEKQIKSLRFSLRVVEVTLIVFFAIQLLKMGW